MTCEESVAVNAHVPCPKCGSSDAATEYSDGHTHCFSCGRTWGGDRKVTTREEPGAIITQGEYQDLPERSISEKTCRKFGYKVAKGKSGLVHIAPFYGEDGAVVAQEIRRTWLPKDDRGHFAWRGSPKGAGLWGQHLWTPRPDSQVFLTVAEGKLDCLSIAEAQSCKYPVVSIPGGNTGAKRAIAEAIEWVEQFPWTVFAFDMDGPGQRAARECAELLTPGKAKIAHLPLNDPNELIKSRRAKDLINALFDAKPYRPEGVINGADILEELKAPPAKALVPFPWPKVEEMTGGFWPGSCTVIAAGTNAGKTPLVYNLVYHLLKHGETVGVLHTEQKHKEAALGIMQLELGLRLDPRHQHGAERGFDDAFKVTAGSGRWFYFTVDDSPDELVSKVKYLVQACGCGWIVIDHLHDVVSHFTGQDERRFIDNLVAQLKQIWVRFHVGMFLVVQLSLPEGNKGFEHGMPVGMKNIKGAGSISQAAAVVLGYERNLMDEAASRVGQLRVIKNRHGGRTGLADNLYYDETSGRLVPVDGKTGEVYGYKDETQGSPPPF